MKKLFLLLIMVLGVFLCPSYAQTVSCQPNMDFEYGNYTIWQYFTGTCCPISTPTAGLSTPNRFDLMTTTSAPTVDPFGGFPTVGDGLYSLRIGTCQTLYYASKAVYYVHVPVSTSGYNLIYRYAVVMEDPGHTAAQQPRFQVQVFDSATNTLLPGSNVFTAGSLPGFIGPVSGTCSPDPGASVFYKPWATASFNLSAYGGHTIRFEAAAGNCALGGHFGYGYIDMTCGLFAVTTIAACGSSTIQLVAPINYASYAWYDSSTFATLYGVTDTINVPTPTVATTLAVIITPATGFGSPDTVYTTIYPSLPVTISGNTTICAGDTTTLTGSSAGGTWSSSSVSVATVGTSSGHIMGISAGTSVITYSLPGGCTATATVTVTSGLPAIIGNTTVCAGLTTDLSDAVIGGTWSSSITTIATVSGTGAVFGVSAGSAVVSYLIAGGCATGISVTVNPSPANITGLTNICTGNTTNLSDVTINGTWSSSDGTIASVDPGSGVVTGTGTGTAVITYTMPGGCYTTVSVTVNPAPSAIEGTLSLCAGFTTALSDAVSGGTWSSGTPAVATVSGTGVVTGVTGGDAVIFYSTGAGCTTSVTVTVTPSPGAGTITGDSAVCVGSAINLTDAVTGGVWSSSNGSATVSGGSVSGISVGMDTVSYAVTNSCGTATVTKVITIDNPADAGSITGSGGVCSGSSIVLSDTVSGGVWGSSNTAVATVSGDIVTGGIAGSVTIGYAFTNACGTAATTKSITVYPLPLAGDITGVTEVCTGASVTLSENTTGGVWSSGNTAIVTINTTGAVTISGTGTAVISYTKGPDVNGCSSSATFTLTVRSTPDFTVSSIVSQVSCYGANDGSIAVTISGGTPPFQYLWSNASTDSLITGLAPGHDTLHVTEPVTQCRSTNTYTIIQPDSLTAMSTTTNDVCDQGSGTATVVITGGSAPYHYLWSNSGATNNISGLVAGTYSVTITDTNNCLINITTLVGEDTCSEIVIHDVLTPNGDGVNDTWVIEGLSLYPKNSVAIFDKWGDMVYEKTNYNNDWNGKGKNGALPDGTYYYLVKLNSVNLKGGKNTWTGSLLIKR